jgi:hypothetical protein
MKLNKIMSIGIIVLMILSCLALAMPQVKATTYYNITVSSDNGAMTFSPINSTQQLYGNWIQQVESGTDIYFSIKINYGYILDTVLVDGTNVTVTGGVNGFWQVYFNDVTESHTLSVNTLNNNIYVQFNTYVVGGNGTIHWFDTSNQYIINSHVLGSFNVLYGHMIQFNAIPDEGYIFSNFTITASNMYIVLSTNPISFVVTGNFNITAQFVYAPVVFTYTLSPDYQAIYKYSNIEYYQNGVVYQFGNWSLLSNPTYTFTGNIYFTHNGYVRAGNGVFWVEETDISVDSTIAITGVYNHYYLSGINAPYFGSFNNSFNYNLYGANSNGTFNFLTGIMFSFYTGAYLPTTVTYEGIKVHWYLNNGAYGVCSYNVTYNLGTNINNIPTPTPIIPIGAYGGFTFNILAIIFFFLVFILPLGYKFGNIGMFVGLIFSLIICVMVNLIPNWCIYLVGLGLILIVWQTVGSRFGVGIPQISHRDNGES